MNARTFKIALAFRAGLVLLSGTSLPGATIAFLFGIAVAFVIAPLTFLLQMVARAVGISLTSDQILYGMAACYGLAVLLAARETYFAWARSHAAVVRLSALKMLLLVALPLIAWLSSRALIRAWPG